MRRDLVDILRCPRCKKGAFFLEMGNEQDEITHGSLRCRQCNEVFRITNGIPALLYELTPEIMKDRKKAIDGKVRALGFEGAKEITEDKRLFYARRCHFQHEGDGESYLTATRTNVEDMIPLMKLQNSPRTLEIGAGTCWSTAMLAQHGCRCVATDISTELKLEVGDAFFGELGIYFERVQASMQNLPFADGVFDIVFATTAIHHAADLLPVFNEVRRVLKQEGHLYCVNEPVMGIFDLKAKRKFNSGEDIHRGAIEKPYSLWQWVRALKKNRLNPVIYFPHYTDEHLRNRPAASPQGRFFRYAWKNKIIRQAMLRGILYPLVMFSNFGICFGITACKSEKVDFWCRFTTREP